jgi:hypothetical protein
MSAGLILVLIVAAAYLAAHAASEWLARRYFVVSGAEYLLLGILLGPEVSGLIRTSVVEVFTPFLTLALGWTGAWIGTHFQLRRLVRTRGIVFEVAFIEALLTLAVISGVMTWVLAELFELTMGETVLPAVALGAIGVASSPIGVALARERLGRPSAVTRQLEQTTFIDALVAIVAFGIVLCLKHPVPLDIERPPTATEWAVISIGIGLIGGALFYLFLGRERDEDRLFISLAGAIILASGAAAYLRLSPLLPTMIIGAILVNTSRSSELIKRLMTTVERPFYFVLLLFAGTAWRPATRTWWFVPVILFVALRVGAKIGSARLAARITRRLRTLGPDWGQALLGQGAVAVAIAVNYRLHDTSLLVNVVFTVGIASAVLTDLLGGRLAGNVVRRQLDRINARWRKFTIRIEAMHD